jgi:hypothetical protein
MTAITQRIPNYLGGVSKQTDERIFPGQVREAINAYPDPTFGLSKRPGGRYIGKLTNSTGATIAAGALDNSSWFSIIRDNQEKYVGSVLNGTVNIWSLLNGARKTVTYEGSAAAYLVGGTHDFSYLTVNDYTWITNKTVKVQSLPAPTVARNLKATIRVLEVEYSAEYSVTIAGTTYSFITRNADNNLGANDPPKKLLSAQEILTTLQSTITASGCTKEIVGTSLELTFTSSTIVSVKGGQSGAAIRCYQDTVENIARLSSESKHGRIVEITNTTANAANLYLGFIANNGTSGPGYWEETVSPFVSTGLNPATMPHLLIRNTDGTFVVKPASWEPRLVGDDLSNSHPSFVNTDSPVAIQQLFFFNNRLGALTEDNVSMSQAGEYFNFYFTTAATIVASDPVDISCSSVKPAVLHAVVPTAQGLLLFSNNQQFLMRSESGTWTPSTVSIKVVSSYESNPMVAPVELGTTIAFSSNNLNYTRVFEMTTRGYEENPMVADQSKVVSEWIPSGLNQMVSSPQNSLISMAGSTSEYLYIYKFFDQGNERKVSAWVNWRLPGTVQHHAIENDKMHMVLKQSGGYIIQVIQLVESPATSALVSNSGKKVDPYLDCWSLATSAGYSDSSHKTKIYLPFPYDTGREICVVVGLSTLPPSSVQFDQSGFVYFPTVQTDSGGKYVLVQGDFTSNTVFVGYAYNYSVELPRYYFTKDENTDFVGSTTISRFKFYLGTSSNLDFILKTNGRPDWVGSISSKLANQYLANDTPIDPYHIYTVPVHQKTENFTMTLTSK